MSMQSPVILAVSLQSVAGSVLALVLSPVLTVHSVRAQSVFDD